MAIVEIRSGRVGQSNRGKVTPRPPVSQPIVYPAPVEGLVTAISLSQAMPGAASILNNWLPTLRGARVRGGKVKTAILAVADQVDSMFVYKFGANQKMFAATSTAIYDVSSPPAPPATTPNVVSGMTSGEWSVLQHTNTGGSFLCCVNGTDPRQLYDGTSWTTPAVTFPDATTTSNISQAFLFKQRQFLIKTGSMDAYYLGVNSVSGAASLLPLGGVMKAGGSLLMGFGWSLESGNGLANYCTFVSTEGEVAVYQGDDPSVAASWSLTGVYNMPKPLGKNAFIRSGGDILICTVQGLIPLSEVLRRKQEELGAVAVSRQIEEDWRRVAQAMPYGWTIQVWQEMNLAFISFPYTSVAPDVTFVLNVQTGKWTTVTGWVARSYASIQGSIYFGDDTGNIWQGDTSGADDDAPFNAVYLSHFIPVGDAGETKAATVATMYFEGKVDANVRLFARADGNITDPPSTTVTVGSGSVSEWDVGLWDQAQWDAQSLKIKIKRRQNVRAEGNMLALGCVITSGGSVPLQLEVDMGLMQIEAGAKEA